MRLCSGFCIVGAAGCLNIKINADLIRIVEGRRWDHIYNVVIFEIF